MSGGQKRDESVAASGAQWMTVAFMLVGILNYAYSLFLTRILDVTAYSNFAAGQSLILWASTVATVSVPLPLARNIARARTDEERVRAIRFSQISGLGFGIVTGAVVGVIAAQFGGARTAAVVAASIFILFVGTTATGRLQGEQRMVALASLYVSENILKNAAGLLLVLVAGLRGDGALAAFGIGGLVMFIWWPRAPRVSGQPWRSALTSRDLWRRTLRMAAIQAVVSLFVAVDTVLITLLPGDRALVASYQASTAVSRVALFVASALAAAFFPSLSRQTSGGMIAGRALRMYCAVALPLYVVLATTPAPLLGQVFPAQYGAVATLLRFTAATGLAAGGITLLTAFFQAAGDLSCLPWLGACLAVYVVALLAGYRIDAVTGIAVGAAAGSLTALALIGWCVVRREGIRLLARIPFIEPAVGAAVLIVLRPHEILWLAMALLIGLRAGIRFIRPGARHAGPLRLVSAEPVRTADQPAASVLADAVWRDNARRATAGQLQQALALARRNRVEGRLARAYPAQLAQVLTQTRAAAELFRRNAREAVGRLQQHGVPAVLIEAGDPADHLGTEMDLTVPEQCWDEALAALASWSVRATTYQLKHSTVALLSPASGPSLQLHTNVAWFGLPELATGRLLAGACVGPDGLLVPSPADQLRISLAQSLFQRRSLDLAELVRLRDLLDYAVIDAAREAASHEGWRPDFDHALAQAHGTISQLDRGRAVKLPVPLPAPRPVSTGRAAFRSGPSWPSTPPEPWAAAESANQEAALQELIRVAQMQGTVTG